MHMLTTRFQCAPAEALMPALVHRLWSPHRPTWRIWSAMVMHRHYRRGRVPQTVPGHVETLQHRQRAREAGKVLSKRRGQAQTVRAPVQRTRDWRAGEIQALQLWLLE